MKLAIKIALRYAFSLRRLNFISIITAVSFIGLTVGVAALIIVMGIFNGFASLTMEQIVGFDPHVKIYGKTQNLKKLENQLSQQNTNYESAILTFSGRIVGNSEENLQVFDLIGLDAEKQDYQFISEKVIFGRFGIGDAWGTPQIVLGVGLADRLDVLPGDTVLIMSPQMIETAIRTFSMRRGVRFLVSGIFRANFREFDLTRAYCSFPDVRRLYRKLPPKSTALEYRFANFDDAESFVKQTKNIIPNENELQTWQELNSQLFGVMKFERLAAFSILSLIIIIAVFNLLASLAMTVVKKQHDIALLKALGASKNMISKIFIAEGLIIGILSSITGAGIGLALCYGQIHYQWFSLDQTKYLIPAIPIVIDPFYVSAVILMTMLLSFAATIYPSSRAASVLSAETLGKTE